jgi:hypothetical protein
MAPRSRWARASSRSALACPCAALRVTAAVPLALLADDRDRVLWAGAGHVAGAARPALLGPREAVVIERGRVPLALLGGITAAKCSTVASARRDHRGRSWAAWPAAARPGPGAEDHRGVGRAVPGRALDRCGRGHAGAGARTWPGARRSPGAGRSGLSARALRPALSVCRALASVVAGIDLGAVVERSPITAACPATVRSLALACSAGIEPELARPGLVGCRGRGPGRAPAKGDLPQVRAGARRSGHQPKIRCFERYQGISSDIKEYQALSHPVIMIRGSKV